MGSYSICYKPSVDKDLRGIPKSIAVHILNRIDELSTEPVTVQAKKLSGTERMYRLRVGEYRIIYEVDHKDSVITVHYIRHRREAYRKF
jgi:mRNA interferase RelE/StbE